MKKALEILITILVLIPTKTFSQTGIREIQVGQMFNIKLPDYMSKTAGPSSEAAIQYGSQDTRGYIICYEKEYLHLIELEFSSIKDFYNDFMLKEFFKDEKDKKISKPDFQKNGEVNFVESDVTISNGIDKTYYLFGGIETKMAYYIVLSYTTAENKNKYKPDFQKILYSIKIESGESGQNEYRAGNAFKISLPHYMSRSYGLDNAALYYDGMDDSLSFASGKIYFFAKENLGNKYSSLNELYEDIIKELANEKENMVVSEPKSSSREGMNFIESDVTYYEKDSGKQWYYLVAFAETKTAYYLILSSTDAKNKDKFKPDFQKILKSLKEQM